LIRKRGWFCSRGDLRAAWEESELQSIPQDGTMNDAVGELRSRVRALGLKIPNAKRNMGWKLVDINDSDE
jgi:hypothetical protein